MSELPLPPAAVEITSLRRAVEAAVPERMPRLTIVGMGVTAAIVVATVAAALVLDGDVRPLIAIGLIAALLALAALVMLPLQRAARRSRDAVTLVTATLDDTVGTVVAHLASIGYTVSADVAADWVVSPESTATAPLVHDSVIASRWWRPADGDDRVFVEPYLRQDGVASSLPPVPRPA